MKLSITDHVILSSNQDQILGDVWTSVQSSLPLLIRRVQRVAYVIVTFIGLVTTRAANVVNSHAPITEESLLVLLKSPEV